MLRDPMTAKTLSATDCDNGARIDTGAADVVVLDWTGGTSPIYPNDYLEGVDLTAFETADDGTLADHAETFKELVRREVARIFCDWPATNVIVINGEDDEPADTVVHLTQELQPGWGMDIGEAEYDPCNRQDDNAALVFGVRLRQLGNVYTFDEWVMVFANVSAHEIGHTFGYGHVLRDERPDVASGFCTELMLDRHTMAEMRRPQRFIADQTNCPDDFAIRSRRVDTGFVTCGAADPDDRD